MGNCKPSKLLRKTKERKKEREKATTTTAPNKNSPIRKCGIRIAITKTSETKCN